MAPLNDLYGNVPDKAPVALLIVDAINDLSFPEAKQFLPFAKAAAEGIARLKGRMKSAGLATIYVNDNFGRWRSDFKRQVQHCLGPESLGRAIVERLHPEEEDYFVLKPKHSGFYSTTLELLLDHLETKTLIITGFATNICVLFTANDAYQRGYRVVVPADCVAANTAQLSQVAQEQMRDVLKANIDNSEQLTIERLYQPDATDAGVNL